MRQIDSRREIPRTMITTAKTVKNDNVYCRFHNLLQAIENIIFSTDL
jgi:hypothetical protein